MFDNICWIISHICAVYGHICLLRHICVSTLEHIWSIWYHRNHKYCLILSIYVSCSTYMWYIPTYTWDHTGIYAVFCVYMLHIYVFSCKYMLYKYRNIYVRRRAYMCVHAHICDGEWNIYVIISCLYMCFSLKHICDICAYMCCQYMLNSYHIYVENPHICGYPCTYMCHIEHICVCHYIL